MREFFPKKTQPSSHHAAEATATYTPRQQKEAMKNHQTKKKSSRG
jgi:hypothetical protein